jgi:hypothetical protein
MFAIRVAAFIISLLLLTEAVAPEDGWFIALTVLTGLSLFGWIGRAPRIYIGPRVRRLRWQDEW